MNSIKVFENNRIKEDLKILAMDLAVKYSVLSGDDTLHPMMVSAARAVEKELLKILTEFYLDNDEVEIIGWGYIPTEGFFLFIEVDDDTDYMLIEWGGVIKSAYLYLDRIKWIKNPFEE